MADRTISGNYLIEIDGVSVCQAQEVTGGEKTNEPFEIPVGDSDLPYIGRGKSKVSEVMVKQSHGLNNEYAEMSRIFDDYFRGINTDPLNIRVVTLGDDGFRVIATTEYIDCVPMSIKQIDKKADSKEYAGFEFKFRPYDMYTN